MSPLVVIAGETGSGKSALAIQLARKIGGELLCADSRTVYRYMDIGTAKPTAADQALVPHHGLDLVNPNEQFTVADFKSYACRIIDDCAARGTVPIMVGGTGLYIDAVLYDYQFRPPADPQTRLYLEALSVEQLQQQVLAAGLALPENARNPRHLIRTLETDGATSVKAELRPNSLIFGMAAADRETLRQRLAARVEQMVADGFVEEVRSVSQRYGWDCRALQAPGYRAFRDYLEGAATLDEAKQSFVRNDMDLAKRQRTWFRRNKSIHWLSNEDKLAEVVDTTTTLLSK